MSVMSAATFLPMPRPIATIVSASALASSRAFMKAPSPHFTSSTSASMPSAIFLLMIEAEISGQALDRGGHVAQRVELAVRGRDLGRLADQAEARSPAAPARKSLEAEPTSKPGIASSLSSVPPVWPSPRPEIIGT